MVPPLQNFCVNDITRIEVFYCDPATCKGHPESHIVLVEDNQRNIANQRVHDQELRETQHVENNEEVYD